MATYTRTSWAQALLGRLGAPATPANVAAIVAWETAEGGHWNNNAYYNPLNTTQPAAGASSMNSVGVKAYTSWDQGLSATTQTLQNGLYGSILSALQAGDSAMNVARAIASTPWGTGSLVEKELSHGTLTDTSSPSSGPTQAGLVGGPGLIPSPSGAVSSALGLGSLGDDLKNFAIRFGVLIVGSALVVVGLYRSVQPSVQKVANVAGDAAKAGAAA